MRKWKIYKTKDPCDPDRDLPWRLVTPNGFVVLKSRTFEAALTWETGIRPEPVRYVMTIAA